MRTVRLSIVCVAAVLVAVSLSSSGFGWSGSGSPGQADRQVAAAAATLEVVRGPENRKLSLDALRAMPATEGYGGIKSSTGKITPPSRLKGVSVETLCRLVGGLDARTSVAIVASDGYEMTIPAEQITAGAFKIYDVGTGEERVGRDRMQLIVAYESDGKPLDAKRDGEVRLALVGPSPTVVTDGHWWVKWVAKVAVKPQVKEWTLALSGARDERIDRATFESCAAPKCHGARWTDPAGHEWEGVPLYVIVGRVDDQQRHEAQAFNRALNARGYTLAIRGRGAREVTVGAAAITPNARLVVAHRRDGESLPDADWPLRLVGAGVTKEQQLGGITDIRLALPQNAPPVVR
jgi:hypothetical protein